MIKSLFQCFGFSQNIFFGGGKENGKIQLALFMILYHGSSKKLETIKKSQAIAGQGITVPESELLDAIYLTPELEFAFAIAVMPEGAAEIDSQNKTIKFQNPELFDPDKKVYVYSVDSDKIPKENLIRVDERQFAVTGIDELKPEEIKEFKAREILDYFELLNWKENKELLPNRELKIW